MSGVRIQTGTRYIYLITYQQKLNSLISSLCPRNCLPGTAPIVNNSFISGRKKSNIPEDTFTIVQHIPRISANYKNHNEIHLLAPSREITSFLQHPRDRQIPRTFCFLKCSFTCILQLPLALRFLNVHVYFNIKHIIICNLNKYIYNIIL